MANDKPKRGRPTIISRYKTEIIAAELELGQCWEYAAVMAGTTEQTCFDWKTRGRLDLENGEETEYAHFYLKTAQAKAKHAKQRISILNDAHEEIGEDLKGSKQFIPQSAVNANQFLLTRMHGSRFHEQKQTKVEISGPNGGPVQSVSGKDALSELMSKLGGSDD